MGGADSSLVTMPATEIDISEITNTKSHLLELPAELRNRIYAYALKQGGAIMLFRAGMPDKHEPPLLRTCRQIREETRALF